MATRNSGKGSIGQSPEEAMGVVYQVAAQEVSRMMENATRSQQALQTVAFAANSIIVERILKMGAS